MKNFFTNMHLIYINSHKFFCTTDDQCLSIHDAFIRDLYIAQNTPNPIPAQDLVIIYKIFTCLNDSQITFSGFSRENIELVMFIILHDKPESLDYFFGESETIHNKNFEIFLTRPKCKFVFLI